MSISLNIIESNRQIQKLINQSLAVELNKKVKSNTNRVVKQIKAMIPTWLGEQDEVLSLLADGVPNSLNAQFGLPIGTSSEAVAAIMVAVSETITVEINKFDANLKGSIFFKVQPEDFTNVLSLPEGYIQTLTNNLHWLDWLVTMGGSPIVGGYEYKPANDGRSGGGIMVGGVAWQVPSQYAGTIDNNFITRALQNREQEITNALKGLF